MAKRAGLQHPVDGILVVLRRCCVAMTIRLETLGAQLIFDRAADGGRRDNQDERDREA